MNLATVVECDALSRWYGSVIAVNNLTTDVRDGITGLLGPNGAGKSSLMRLMMGLLKPSSGTIHVLDEDPWVNTALMARIGFVGEGDAPWRDQTGFRAAVLNARLRGMTGEDAEEAALRSLRQVGLQDAQDRVVGGYSRGMRQRLKFALAIMHEPELYVLDEPLLGTDPATRHELISLIRGLERDGRSVLVSTHVLSDVEAMTQRILLMNHSRMVAHGEVSEIRDLLEQYPRTIRIATPDPRAFGTLIWQWPSVLSLEAAPDAVTVRTKAPKEFFESLHELVEREPLPVTAVTSPDDNIEAVFEYLVE